MTAPQAGHHRRDLSLEPDPLVAGAAVLEMDPDLHAFILREDLAVEVEVGAFQRLLAFMFQDTCPSVSPGDSPSLWTSGPSLAPLTMPRSFANSHNLF